MTRTSKNIIIVPGRLMVAIGGNAIHPENIERKSDKQKVLAEITVKALLPLLCVIMGSLLHTVTGQWFAKY